MYYSTSKENLLKKFNSSLDGLDAKQVYENREKYGSNKFYEKEDKGIITIFFEQFKDLLVLILIIAAVISFITGSPESAVVIIFVLILNAILGTIQYLKAENSLNSLKKLSAPTAHVFRDGIGKEILASELVPGDIVFLEAGNIVPADCRLLDSYSLKVNESTLTGESESVEKDDKIIKSDKFIPLSDRTNMVFSGSSIVYGRCKALVVATGEKSELGKIANLMNETKSKETPLQISMNKFSKNLSIGILVICIAIFLLDMYRGMNFTDALLFAVALAVAAIPEALSSIITISLAIGTSHMAENNAIVKKLNSVESLGSVSIICSDKTGTLTQNKMTVKDIFTFDKHNDQKLSICSILCNDTKIIEGNLVGDPTETALVSYYINKYDNYYKILEKYPRVAEIPFDSDRKLMSTVHRYDDKLLMFTKGAIDSILPRTNNLTEKEKKELLNINSNWSNEGLRVLAFAIKDVTNEKIIGLEDEYDLEFLGIMNELDPPRPESKKAVKDCFDAGIRPIMITGDHKITASSIAKNLGIMRNEDIAVTGEELHHMDDDLLLQNLERISVYARVSPADKIRIVKAWQDKNKIVAMTGDGVNDAPALKASDVGIAMGITGTEVSKDAASIILTDDNFATIIKSILNGRNIYENIKNAIKFLLSGNMAGIFVVLYAALMTLPTPFTAVYLLFINLVTDSLPALAISMEPLNKNLIYDKPRPKDEAILTKSTVTQILVQGVLIGTATIIAFYIGLGHFDTLGFGTYISNLLNIKGVHSISIGMTMAFATLCLARLWHGFSSRSNSSIKKIGLLSNLYTIYAFLLGSSLLFIILLYKPIGDIFGVSILSFEYIKWIIILSFLPTFLIQMYRFLLRK